MYKIVPILLKIDLLWLKTVQYTEGILSFQKNAYFCFILEKKMDISTDIVLNHKLFFTERAEHPSTLQHKIKTEGKLVYGNL